MVKRKSKSKENDVDFKLDKNGIKDNLSNHPNSSDSLKNNIQKQNEKSAEEVASSKSFSNYITHGLPDYNSLDDDNEEKVYVKKSSSGGKLKNSNYDEYINEFEQNKKNAIEEDQEIDDSPIDIDSETENDEYSIAKSKSKKSNMGEYVNLNETKDINKSTFSIPFADSKAEIYDGQGKKLGVRPLITDSDIGVPVVKEFYVPIRRLIEGAYIDDIFLVIVRGYQSFDDQIENRRKYAPNNKKNDLNWLKTASPTSDFINENGDKVKVNKPGYGYHILGNTFDIDTTDKKSYNWMIKNAHNYGFYRTVPNEIWHWEYKPWLYRYGGRENPGDIENNYVGGWKNELWEKLYNKISNEQDPKGAKFLPKKHSSWLGKENIAENESIDNSIPEFSEDEDQSFAEFVEESEIQEQEQENESEPLDIDKDETLSKHLTLGRAIYSDTAKAKNIDNTPDLEIHLKNLKAIAKNVYEPLYNHLQSKYNLKPYITSGYRSGTLNNAIGGSSTSQHRYGQALDLTVTDPSKNYIIYNYIKNNLTYDQLIWEGGTKNNPKWVHVSFVDTSLRSEFSKNNIQFTTNRNERLAMRKNLSPKYVQADNYLT